MNSILTFAENNSSIQNDSINHINTLNNKNYSQYLNLSNDEIINETNEIKKKIIEYHNTNKVLKNELANILEKLNLLSIKYTNQLNEINDKENSIQARLNNKKNDYFRIKNYNTQIKKEYNDLLKKSKIISESQIIDVLTNHKLNIQKLQNENKDIKKEISKNETQKNQQQTKIMKIKNENLKIKTISNYNDKLNKYLQIKNNFINSINNSNNIIKDNIQEFNKLEKMIQSKNKILSKNEKLYNKINEEINVIKSDLTGTVEEITQKCIDNNVQIYALINKNNSNNNTNKSININEINTELDDINKSNSINISSNVTLVNSPSLNNININTNKNKTSKKKYKLYPTIYRNNSQSFITDKIHLNSNFNNFNSNLNEINELISENNSENKKNNLLNRYNHIIKKPSLSNINNKINIKNFNSFSMDLNNINYNQVDDEIYLKLQNKKKFYLDENERIDFNIKEIKKTFSTKYNNVTNGLKINIVKLNDIKNLNTNIQEEINKLQLLLKEIENDNKIKNEETKKMK